MPMILNSLSRIFSKIFVPRLVHSSPCITLLFRLLRSSRCSDYIHGEEELKKVVVSDIAKYIHKNEKMHVLLDRLRKGGKKLFLLTNRYVELHILQSAKCLTSLPSEFNYTNSVMTYLLQGADPAYNSWRDYFGKFI